MWSGSPWKLDQGLLEVVEGRRRFRHAKRKLPKGQQTSPSSRRRASVSPPPAPVTPCLAAGAPTLPRAGRAFAHHVLANYKGNTSVLGRLRPRLLAATREARITTSATLRNLRMKGRTPPARVDNSVAAERVEREVARQEPKKEAHADLPESRWTAEPGTLMRPCTGSPGSPGRRPARAERAASAMSLSSAVVGSADGATSKAAGDARVPPMPPPAPPRPREARRGQARRGVRGRFSARTVAGGPGACAGGSPQARAPGRLCGRRRGTAVVCTWCARQEICTRCAQVAMRDRSGRRASPVCHGEHGPGHRVRGQATASLLQS